jgi:hypothetical protein
MQNKFMNRGVEKFPRKISFGRQRKGDDWNWLKTLSNGGFWH